MKKGIYVAQLDRFGYTLTVAGKTQEECAAALKAEYIRAYAKINDLDEQTLRLCAEFDVADEYDEYREFQERYRSAFENLFCRFYEFGKVEWE